MPSDAPAYDSLDPSLISVGPRQRQENLDVADLEESIARLGVLQPIIVTRTHELVAGGRRLQCCRNLSIPVPVKFLDTLDELDLREIELEENAKREDLTWKDQTKAIFDLHELYKTRFGASWSVQATASRIGRDSVDVYRYLRVWRNIDDPRIASATGISQAMMIYQRISERKAANVISDVIANAKEIFGPEPTVPDTSSREAGPPPKTSGATASIAVESRGPNSSAPPPVAVESRTQGKEDAFPKSILNESFLTWAPDYTGPKFNLLHVDFPYGTLVGDVQRDAAYASGEEVQRELMECFLKNFDKFTSYSAHVIFWFSMTNYESTRRRLESLGLWVWPYPLVWYLSDGARIVPVVGKTPRRTYHTAFLCSRGERPTVKTINDAYASPTVAKPIHPTQKPRAMLEHFLSLVTDSTTSLLDPTCGSGSALIAAEALGAERVLGLELDLNYFQAAEASLNQARVLRRLRGE